MSIQIKTHASSSAGNCYSITNGRHPLLIECGIRFPAIQKALDFKVSGLAGCLCTHMHQDHCLSVEKVMKAGIDCYMSAQTAEGLKLTGHRVKIVEPLKQFNIGSWSILPFETQHDCAGSIGFLLKSGNDKLLFATDTFYIRYKFKDLNYIMIECNYDLEILDRNVEAGLYPEANRNRVLKSHFSLDNVKNFLRANDLSRVREIHLLHLSSANSDEKMFKSEVERLTGIPTYIGG